MEQRKWTADSTSRVKLATRIKLWVDVHIIDCAIYHQNTTKYVDIISPFITTEADAKNCPTFWWWEWRIDTEKIISCCFQRNGHLNMITVCIAVYRSLYTLFIYTCYPYPCKKNKVRFYNIDILFNHFSNTGLNYQLNSELIRIWLMHHGIYSCMNTLIWNIFLSFQLPESRILDKIVPLIVGDNTS